MRYNQKTLWRLSPIKKDVVYTSDRVAKNIIEHIKPIGKCLDPCLGEGAFLKYLPHGSAWCEITKGYDFFDYEESVDWIVGNPPYSIFEHFLKHSFELSKNVVFLVPTNKIFQRQLIMNMINEYGGIKRILIYGSGNSIGLPFGFSVGAFHFEKDFNGFCNLQLIGNNFD